MHVTSFRVILGMSLNHHALQSTQLLVCVYSRGFVGECFTVKADMRTGILNAVHIHSSITASTRFLPVTVTDTKVLVWTLQVGLS